MNMLKCFILFLMHMQSYFRIGNGDVIGLSNVAFDGPKRGPQMTVEGGGNQGQQGLTSDRAKQYYVENINIVQEDIAMRWPLGIVPYYFDLSSYDYVMNSRTREAMDIIEAVSCVRFTSVLLKPDNNSWIHITNPGGVRDCMHSPTYKGFEVIVYLGLECLSRREIVHTLLHAIGFRDEVTHPQRDQYIRIVWENIQPRYKPLFRRQPDEGPSKSLVEFDPMSIMQFHDRAFSRNGYATIAGLLPGLQIRPSENLSQLDKMKLRLLFGHECNRRSVDDLLDTCKKEFRNDQPDDRPKNSKGNNKEHHTFISPNQGSSAVSDNDDVEGNDIANIDGDDNTVKLKDDDQGTSDNGVTDATISSEPLSLKEIGDENTNDKDNANDKENTNTKENADDKENTNDKENSDDKKNTNAKENANDDENTNDKENTKEGPDAAGADGAGHSDADKISNNEKKRNHKNDDIGAQSEINAIDEDATNAAPAGDVAEVDNVEHTPFNTEEDDPEQQGDSYDDSKIQNDDRIGTIAESKRKKLKRH